MREVLRVQYPQIDRDRGLILGWTKRAEVRVVAHDGRNEGHRASMFFTPEGASPDGATYGVVILSNGDFSVDGMALEPKLGHEILKRAIAGTLED